MDDWLEDLITRVDALGAVRDLRTAAEALAWVKRGTTKMDEGRFSVLRREVESLLGRAGGVALGCDESRPVITGLVHAAGVVHPEWSGAYAALGVLAQDDLTVSGLSRALHDADPVALSRRLREALRRTAGRDFTQQERAVIADGQELVGRMAARHG